MARGYFRNYLYPRGIAQKQDAKVSTMMKKAPGSICGAELHLLVFTEAFTISIVGVIVYR